MFNAITHRATSALRQFSAAGMVWSVAPGLCRLPASNPLPSASLPRWGAASLVSRQFSSPPRLDPAVRDWPAASDRWEGGDEVGPDGHAARQASLKAPAGPKEVHAAREAYARRTGEGIDPRLSDLTTRVGMAMALENSRDELVAGEGPGVAAGLRDLDIRPGDAVAEQDPNLPSLGVRLAVDSVQAFITMSRQVRLREVCDELQRFRQGRPMALRKIGLDYQPKFPAGHHEKSARAAARQLTVVPGSGFAALPRDIRFKALIARSAFDYLDLPQIQAALQEAGRCLAPGGGLVFEFSHAAGRPVPASAGVRLGAISFGQIEQALQDSGLRLQSLYMTFQRPDEPEVYLIPARRVLPGPDGQIQPQKADAAAWSGWDEIARDSDLQGRPVRIQASGLFIKEAQAKD